jgi:hypothetical protein
VPLTRRGLEKVAVLITEIYPSLIPLRDGAAVKDARQVEAMARFLLQHDRAGTLGALFAAPIDKAARRVIEREEGWIFGAGVYQRPSRAARPSGRDAGRDVVRVTP